MRYTTKLKALARRRKPPPRGTSLVKRSPFGIAFGAGLGWGCAGIVMVVGAAVAVLAAVVLFAAVIR